MHQMSVLRNNASDLCVRANQRIGPTRTLCRLLRLRFGLRLARVGRAWVQLLNPIHDDDVNADPHLSQSCGINFENNHILTLIHMQHQHITTPTFQVLLKHE